LKSVVITGASSGIGEAIALRLATNGWVVFAGVRNDSDAERLSAQNSAINPVHIDVTDAAQIKKVVQTVDRQLDGEKLSGLVNNAGIAQMGPLTLQPLDEIKAHFEVNVFGAIATCQAFVPLLGQDTDRSGPPGRIVNITSVGGEVASPFLGAYTATKHAMESVTDTLRRELNIFGIDAIAVGPGAIRTPIWDKAQRGGGHGYEETPWGESLSRFLTMMVQAGEDGLPPERVAEAVEIALSSDNPDARYAPVPNKLTNYYLLRGLPKRWVDKIFIDKLGLDRKP
jgi:NAD(P)-dependent dehydrogenase (short-subunit alcohol dehydrogenase family)